MEYLELVGLKIPIVVSEELKPNEVLLGGPFYIEKRDGREFLTYNPKSCVKLINVGVEEEEK